MQRNSRILIVGAGIGGLTLAAALKRRGCSAEIVERNRTLNALGAGLAVQPNALRVLHQLGIGDDIVRAGTRIRHWDICDQAGVILTETDLAELWNGVGAFVGIERSCLQQVLLSAASDIPLRTGTSVISLDQKDDRVEVAFTDETRAEYDLVVGADGIHSIVRRLAFGAAEPVYGCQMVWRSVVDGRFGPSTSVQFHLGEGCFFGLCPVGDNRTYGFGNISGPRIHDPVSGRRARLRDRFSAFGESVRAYIDALDCDSQVHCSPIEWLEDAQWYTGRVLLIGDAAHASSPMMGQGGALAMEDGFVLAGTLASSVTIDGALRAFVERREPRVRWVREQSRIVTESFQMPVSVRNSTLRERGDQMLRQRFTPLKSEV